MDIVKIYLLIGLLLGIGLHVYAQVKFDLWARLTPKQKIYRIPIGLLFHAVCWIGSIPWTVYKIVKKEPISLTHF
jgi:hypothetical protein